MPRGVYTRKPRKPRDLKARPALYPISASIAYVPLTQGQFACVDWDDALRLEKFNWCAQWDSRMQSFYAVRNDYSDGGRQNLLGMHRAVMNPGKDIYVDHINNPETLDNRRANLRLATPAQNQANQRLRKTNKTGMKGTYFDKRDGTWFSSIRVNGKCKYLGRFPDAESAHKAFLAHAPSVRGEFFRKD